MYEIFVEGQFSAAHRLSDYPGNCARWHGHNWSVTVFFQAETLGKLGMALDFRQAKDALKSVLDKLDHTDLNQVPELAGVNPTCEVIARHIYQAMVAQFEDADGVRVVKATVSETPTAGASYFE